jgi:hypothetical protein
MLYILEDQYLGKLIFRELEQNNKDQKQSSQTVSKKYFS